MLLKSKCCRSVVLQAASVEKSGGLEKEEEEKGEEEKRLKQLVRTCSQEALANKDICKEGDQTVFDALIDPTLPPEERSLSRLVDEGMIILMAGV